MLAARQSLPGIAQARAPFAVRYVAVLETTLDLTVLHHPLRASRSRKPKVVREARQPRRNHGLRRQRNPRFLQNSNCGVPRNCPSNPRWSFPSKSVFHRYVRICFIHICNRCSQLNRVQRHPQRLRYGQMRPLMPFRISCVGSFSTAAATGRTASFRTRVSQPWYVSMTVRLEHSIDAY